LVIWEKELGPDHPDVATSLTNLGNLAQRQGRFDVARDYQERALAIWEKTLGPDHPDGSHALTGIGLAMLGQANPSEAIPYLERALAIHTATGADSIHLAEIRFALARALWDAGPETGRDRERATALAALAHEAFAEAGEGSAKQFEEVLAWEAEHSS
jgi:tetratricopeptide (TPR) repeat protein